MSAMMRSSLAPVIKTLANRNTVSCRHFLWFGKKDNVRFADDLNHATGEEKLVRLAIAQGNKDPFDMQPAVRGPGTKENPNIVQTFTHARMIGCKCEEESTTIKYMWVHLDDPKRCECGYWFKAVPARKFWEEVTQK